MKKKTWLLLGASKGLGAAFARSLLEENNFEELVLVARSEAQLMQLCAEDQRMSYFTADFSKPELYESILDQIKKVDAHGIIYFAAGGPYGAFEQKKWKDHLWAWNVTYLFPAYLIHELLPLSKKQLVVIGSSIAESDGDMYGASYAAAKHALKGLVSSIHLESPQSDLRLFSPPYMDTSLLPKRASVRNGGEPIYSPQEVSRVLWSWLESETQGSQHLIY